MAADSEVHYLYILYVADFVQQVSGPALGFMQYVCPTNAWAGLNQIHTEIHFACGDYSNNNP